MPSLFLVFLYNNLTNYPLMIYNTYMIKIKVKLYCLLNFVLICTQFLSNYFIFGAVSRPSKIFRYATSLKIDKIIVKLLIVYPGTCVPTRLTDVFAVV